MKVENENKLKFNDKFMWEFMSLCEKIFHFDCNDKNC